MIRVTVSGPQGSGKSNVLEIIRRALARKLGPSVVLSHIRFTERQTGIASKRPRS